MAYTKGIILSSYDWNELVREVADTCESYIEDGSIVDVDDLIMTIKGLYDETLTSERVETMLAIIEGEWREIASADDFVYLVMRELKDFNSDYPGLSRLVKAWYRRSY